MMVTHSPAGTGARNIGERGSVLVRPNRIVVCRAQAPLEDEKSTTEKLHAVLEKILGGG